MEDASIFEKAWDLFSIPGSCTLSAASEPVESHNWDGDIKRACHEIDVYPWQTHLSNDVYWCFYQIMFNDVYPRQTHPSNDEFRSCFTRHNMIKN